MAELRGSMETRDMEMTTIEERRQAEAFAQQCAREWDEERRLDRAERLTVEVLEGVTTTAAGALSTWKSGMVPLGAATNCLVGAGFKIGCILNPQQRGLRVACRAGKVLLHSQIAITTRNLILGTTS